MNTQFFASQVTLFRASKVAIKAQKLAIVGTTFMDKYALNSTMFLQVYSLSFFTM